MPIANAHQKQLAHNKKLLSEDLFHPKNSNYPDWVITICFYCAVHMIDSKLATDFGIIDIGEHRDRRKLIKQYLGFNDIWVLYKLIETNSQKARYCCGNIRPLEVEFSIKAMKDLEKLLA